MRSKLAYPLARIKLLKYGFSAETCHWGMWSSYPCRGGYSGILSLISTMTTSTPLLTLLASMDTRYTATPLRIFVFDRFIASGDGTNVISIVG